MGAGREKERETMETTVELGEIVVGGDSGIDPATFARVLGSVASVASPDKVRNIHAVSITFANDTVRVTGTDSYAMIDVSIRGNDVFGDVERGVFPVSAGVRDIVRVIGKGRDVARSVLLVSAGDVLTVATDSGSGSVSVPMRCDYPTRLVNNVFGQENGWPDAGKLVRFDPARLSALFDAVAGVFPRKADPFVDVSSMTVGKAMTFGASFENVSVRGLLMPMRP